MKYSTDKKSYVYWFYWYGIGVIWWWTLQFQLTDCGLVIPYGDIDMDQHRLM